MAKDVQRNAMTTERFTGRSISALEYQKNAPISNEQAQWILASPLEQRGEN